MALVSIVVPVYRSAECLEELHRRLAAALSEAGLDYELLLVEDGGDDNSWEIIERLADGDSRVRGLQLSRNFGQHAAIAAGLAEADGDGVVVMDADLQDRPEDIPRLWEKAAAGYDIVFARRKNRTDSPFRRVGSAFFFFVLDALSGTRTDPQVGSFSLLSAPVVRRFREMGDRNAHYLQALRWLGFRQGFVEVEHGIRFAGKSSYTSGKLVRHMLLGLVSQSERLLFINVYLGFALGFAAVAGAFALVYRKLRYGIDVAGWPSLMVTVAFVGGALLFSIGVLGIYIGRIFDQVKGRPRYVVRRRVGPTPRGPG